MLQYLCLAGNVSIANISDVWHMSDKDEDGQVLVLYSNTFLYFLLILLLDKHIHTHICCPAIHIKMQYLENKIKKQKKIKLYLQV